jgi:KaiC/GvpD/RAD55 family RecA-like ATPase
MEKKESKMYVRLCEGLSDYGKLIPNNEDIYKYVKDQKKDYYVSVYNYNEEQKQKFEKNHSVAGIKDVTTNKLIFDFDSKNIDQARKDAIAVINRLNKIKPFNSINDSNTQIFFSGGKGFHVVIDTQYTFTPKKAKTFATKIAKDLKTFDSVVYNANRILRLPYTKHPESGLYKTPLTLSELEDLSVDNILDLAKDEYSPEPIKSTPVGPSIFETEDSNSPSESLTPDESTLLADLDLRKKPRNLSPWKYALEQGFFPPGQRSNSLLILAATYKAMGYNKTKCYYTLKAAADLQAQRYDQEKFDKKEIYHNIIDQVYSNTWEGGTYAEDTFPEQLKTFLVELGVPRQNAEDLHENFVVSIDKGFDSFGKYAEAIDENTMRFGITDLDNVLRVQVGHLIGILGSPGSGKTSLALTLLNNTSKEGVKSFFASYDMAGNILVQKLVQRQTGLDSDDIFDIYRNDDKEQISRFRKILNKNFANVSFCFKSGQSIDELRESIRKEELRIGEEIKLVIVDYLELVRAKSSDPTQASAEAIQGLREIANEGKVVVCLLQPNKLSSTVSEPILTYNAAKGSAAIAQAVTAMVTCYREGYNPDRPETDKFFNINIVKNRGGPLGKADFDWHGPTGKISPLEDIQRQELKELRDFKKAEKGNDDDF